MSYDASPVQYILNFFLCLMNLTNKRIRYNVSCSCNLVNVGPLMAVIGSGVWDPCKFQRVSHLRSVTARHSSSGRQPNFAALNRRCHVYSAGRPSRWALAHILVITNFVDDVALTEILRKDTCCSIKEMTKKIDHMVIGQHKHSAVAEMSNYLATIDTAEKWGLLCPFPWGSWVRI